MHGTWSGSVLTYAARLRERRRACHVLGLRNCWQQVDVLMRDSQSRFGVVAASAARQESGLPFGAATRDRHAAAVSSFLGISGPGIRCASASWCRSTISVVEGRTNSGNSGTGDGLRAHASTGAIAGEMETKLRRPKPRRWCDCSVRSGAPRAMPSLGRSPPVTSTPSARLFGPVRHARCRATRDAELRAMPS